MTHQQSHAPDTAALASSSGRHGSGFTGPRLNLPRFSFTPAQAASAATMPAGRSTAIPTAMPVPGVPVYPATPMALPAVPAPAPTYAALSAPMPTFAPVATRNPAPRMAPLSPPRPMDNATRSAASISWDRLGAAEAERTLLQRITPVHMGVIMVLILAMLVMTSGPASMRAEPARLSALATGGGSGVEVQPVLAGTTASTAAANAGAARPARAAHQLAPRAARIQRMRRSAMAGYLRVGSGRVSRRVTYGGIPSPAAAANLAIAGGGRVPADATGALRLNGIPSAAASEALGPKTLPYRPSDGVTLPRSFGERDSHAVEANYGTGVLPMEDPVELPAMSPGQSAANAEARVARNELDPNAMPPRPTGGLTIAS